MLHATRARALAKMRRVNDALSAIGAAEDHFAHSTPTNDPPHMAYFTTAYLVGNTGLALVALALLGHHPERATDRLTTAVAEVAARQHRTRGTGCRRHHPFSPRHRRTARTGPLRRPPSTPRRSRAPAAPDQHPAGEYRQPVK
ncbi:MAG: hypothetical protein WCF33_16560 [Pseudonocardiaceae bacterium]